MRGYFDNDEPEVEEPEAHGRDTELTLGWGALLGAVFGLLLVCGLCFGLGYWEGHRRSAAAPETAAAQPATPTDTPNQEPSQGNGAPPKPGADAPAASPPADGGTNPAPAQPGPEAEPSGTPASSPAAAPVAPAPAQPQTQARPTIPVAANEPRPAPAARPASAPDGAQYMVQIAAVVHAEDANVLVNALRKRGFAATAQREPSDGLIHVRIGPFAQHEQANRMCTRLLESGYNAMVQP